MKGEKKKEAMEVSFHCYFLSSSLFSGKAVETKMAGRLALVVVVLRTKAEVARRRLASTR